jgi:DNA polymerase-3 subunit delta
MEVKSAAAERFIGHLPAGLVAALVFGPDQGLVQERAAAVARTVIADLSDPFRVAELDDVVLEADPARLWDESAALSMTGGRRVVRVRGANNGLAGCARRRRGRRSCAERRVAARLRGGRQCRRDPLLSR